MKLIPIKAEYNFSISNHLLKAIATHQDNCREISFYYDEKIISKKMIPAGNLLSDDDHIRNIVEEHCKSSIDGYSDLFNNHANKLLLKTKSVQVLIDNYGIQVNATVNVFNDRYEINLSTPTEDDYFKGSFKSNSFPEALEKLRLFINTISGVSSDLTAHIDELVDDKIEELIKWN